MATYYSHYHLPPSFTMPFMMNPILSPLPPIAPISPVPVPVPIVLTTPQVITQLCPYTGLLVAQPVLTISELVTVAETYITEPMFSPAEEVLISNDEDVKEGAFSIDDVSNKDTTEDQKEDINIDPAEFYLQLPKDLFPSARMCPLDPNSIIDEICKLDNIDNNVPWMLDLEFGIPRAPVTRTIAVYDVRFNSIHCKNAPDAIHPGFVSCSEDFKRVVLFYYDCIFSAWYKGYMALNNDESVKNFQSWLQLPMQIFGMSWS